MEELKSLKEYCKEAKKRLKSGFWQKYHANLQKEMLKAKEAGISVSKVKDFYNQKVSSDIRKVNDDFEEFYAKVKKILDEEGEISNAIGRLTDREVYSTLSYDEQQRYNLQLSEKYVKAVERYRKEKSVLFNA